MARDLRVMPYLEVRSAPEAGRMGSRNTIPQPAEALCVYQEVASRGLAVIGWVVIRVLERSGCSKDQWKEGGCKVTYLEGLRVVGALKMPAKLVMESKHSELTKMDEVAPGGLVDQRKGETKHEVHRPLVEEPVGVLLAAVRRMVLLVAARFHLPGCCMVMLLERAQLACHAERQASVWSRSPGCHSIAANLCSWRQEEDLVEAG